MELHEVQGKLHPKAPFDFSKSLSFTSMFTPAGGEQTISGHSLTKAVYVNDRTVAFTLEDEGTVEKPVLSYTLFSYDEIDKTIESELLDRIDFYLSLSDDLKPFYALGRKDTDFDTLIDDLYGLHQVKFLTPFEAAGWAILSQRISMKAAHTMKDRLVQAVGDNIEVEGVDYLTFPSAHQLKNLGVEKIIALIKNKRKSEFLIAAAEAFDKVDEEFLRQGPVEEVKDWLLDIKGIGEYSAHLELIRGLGRMEEPSGHDRWLLQCAKKVYGSEIETEDLRKIADNYGEFKGYWAYYLRTAC